VRSVPTLSRVAWAAALLIASRPARATDDDKRVCLSTYVDAQAARQDGRLRGSLHALEQCGRQVCPVVIRNDCVRWQREVKDAMPTVVLMARGPDGADRPDARVWLDGQLLGGRLDGRPVDVDPGEHLFRFEVPGAGALELRVVMREGEKDRPITAAFPRTPAETAPPGGAAGQARARPFPTSVGVSAGIGAASLVVALVYAGLGWFGSPGWLSSQSCRPRCAPGDVDAIKQHFVVADVAGAVAFVSFGTATYLYLARPDGVATSSASGAPAPLGAGLVLRAGF
jgi:hypothetical protein